MSLVFTIALDQAKLQALIKRLDPAEWQKRASASVLEGTMLLERAIAQKTRKGKTGGARASVMGRRVSVLEGRVTSSSLVNLILEDGSRPHIIRPRPGRRTASGRPPMLAFPGGSGTVFTRFVRHPGTKGYHAFRDGVAASVRAVEAIFVRRLSA